MVLNCFNGVAEYSVDLHLNKMGLSGEQVMYITVTTLFDVSGTDYTVVLNGIPSVKHLKKICGVSIEDAKTIICTLKEKAVKYAVKFWNFQEEEWTNALDDVLERYSTEILEGFEKARLERLARKREAATVGTSAEQ